MRLTLYAISAAALLVSCTDIMEPAPVSQREKDDTPATITLRFADCDANRQNPISRSLQFPGYEEYDNGFIVDSLQYVVFDWRGNPRFSNIPYWIERGASPEHNKASDQTVVPTRKVMDIPIDRDSLYTAFVFYCAEQAYYSDLWHEGTYNSKFDEIERDLALRMERTFQHPYVHLSDSTYRESWRLHTWVGVKRFGGKHSNQGDYGAVIDLYPPLNIVNFGIEHAFSKDGKQSSPDTTCLARYENLQGYIDCDYGNTPQMSGVVDPRPIDPFQTVGRGTITEDPDDDPEAEDYSWGSCRFTTVYSYSPFRGFVPEYSEDVLFPRFNRWTDYPDKPTEVFLRYYPGTWAAGFNEDERDYEPSVHTYPKGVVVKRNPGWFSLLTTSYLRETNLVEWSQTIEDRFEPIWFAQLVIPGMPDWRWPEGKTDQNGNLMPNQISYARDPTWLECSMTLYADKIIPNEAMPWLEPQRRPVRCTLKFPYFYLERDNLGSAYFLVNDRNDRITDHFEEL